MEEAKKAENLCEELESTEGEDPLKKRELLYKKNLGIEW